MLIRCPHCKKIIVYVCKRCGHRWSPRTARRPARCAGCKDPKWDIARGILKPGPKPKRKHGD